MSMSSKILGNFTETSGTICSPFATVLNSRGIFLGGKLVDSIFSVFLAQIILTFSTARIIYFVLRPFRQPKVVCYILAGIVLGPSFLCRNKTFKNTIFPKEELILLNTVATMGAAGYTFIIAVKMDTTIVLRTAKHAWAVGLTSFIVPFIAILFFKNMFKSQNEAGPLIQLGSLFLSSAFSTTYFPIVAHIMEELDLVTTELGRLVMTSAMLVEIFSHLTTVVAIILYNKSYIGSLYMCGIVIVPVLFLFYVLKPAIRWIIKGTPEGKHVREGYVTAVMLGAMFMTLASDYAWGIFLPGAFLMGTIIPDGPPLGSILVEKYEMVIMEVFLPFFFLQVGFQTDISSLQNLRIVLITVLFLGLAYFAKIIGAMVASVYLDIRIENAFLIGIILNFRGVFDLNVYQTLLNSKAVDQECYTVLVLFSVFFISFFTPFISIFYKPQARLTNPNPKIKYLRTLQSMPQNAELHVLTCIYNDQNVHGIINLFKAFNPNSYSPLRVDVIHAIELVGRNTPSLDPYNIYSNKVRNSTSQQIFRAFYNFSKHSNGLVAINPFRMVAPYKSMDNIICNLAEDRQVPFIVVPFHRDSLLSSFCCRLQATAPCTIGILLQKGLNPRKNFLDDQVFNRIGVLFIGGADDREALSLAIRISRNHSATVSLLRVNQANNDKNTSILEKNLDDLMIKEFMGRNSNNPSMKYREVVANNSLEMVDVLRSMEGDNDLIMVGKNPTKTQFEKEMVEWIEYPELGTIGDMFASWNDRTYILNTSVLVMQHCKVSTSFVIDMYKTSNSKSDPSQDIV
ncbi:cation/H(+) antiporter 15-like [Mercurialis annua]|uniref:cation/H(+) antiporter 15-like n=1 Tax=Mercurialis annua TaxID=3986 RepID=UPI00215EDEA9|nr:cation/H(+) antiporter 15-like [Mercurialis annua]